MTDPLKALFGKPDYSRIVRDTTATISITAAEMAAVLEAYDRGIDTLDGTTRTALDSVILYSFGSAFGVCRSLKSCDSAALTAPTVLCFSALKMQKPLMTNPAKEKASCVSIGAFFRRFKQCLKPPYSLRRLTAFNLPSFVAMLS